MIAGPETGVELAVDDRLRLTQRCDIPEETLDAWLCAVYAKYNCVSFHNFKHAFMVAQMVSSVSLSFCF